eukprot:3642269-Pleurochrysis_carterae.AAC.3
MMDAGYKVRIVGYLRALYCQKACKGANTCDTELASASQGARAYQRLTNDNNAATCMIVSAAPLAKYCRAEIQRTIRLSATWNQCTDMGVKFEFAPAPISPTAF